MASKTPPSVLIVDYAHGYTEMFKSAGWRIVTNIREADLVQFTGGSDVDPTYYGEPKHRSTHCNPIRDLAEQQIFLSARRNGVPVAGICRGGQFLNVMCGGRMYQDVNNHGIPGVHETRDENTGEVFNVTSTHHQMIIPTRDAEVIGVASESTEKISINPKDLKEQRVFGRGRDVEICYYEEFNALCFQPHPEFPGHDDLANRYFAYVKENCGVSV